MTPSQLLSQRRELFAIKDALEPIMEPSKKPVATTEEGLVEEAADESLPTSQPLYEAVAEIAPKDQLKETLKEMLKKGTEKERICAVNQSVRLIEVGAKIAVEAMKQKMRILDHEKSTSMKPRGKAKVVSNLVPVTPQPAPAPAPTAPSSPASPEAGAAPIHDRPVLPVPPRLP